MGWSFPRLSVPCPILLLCLCTLLILARAEAAGQVTEIRPVRNHEWLRAVVRARDLLDERTRLTIESGLPGTCIYELRLEDRAGRPVAEQYVERTLRFDLWESRYLLGEDEEERQLPTLAAADSALSYLADCSICPLDRLQTNAEYRLVVRIAVRPLAPEDRRRLSRYVSRTSGSGGEEVAFDLSGVFNHIIGEKGKSRQVVQHAGAYFRLTDVEEIP